MPTPRESEPKAGTKKMWLQGIAPKFVIALNTQPRETTEWMRTQYRRQAEHLRTLERAGAPGGIHVPSGTSANFLSKIGQLNFKVDLESDGIIEWPILGKKAEDYENPANPAWPAERRVFYCLNPHMHELQEAEKARVGELSFRAADPAEERAALMRQQARVGLGIKVSSVGGGDAVPIERAEVLRPAAEVFGVVAMEHGHYYGENKNSAPDASSRRTFVAPEARVPDKSMPPSPQRAAHSVLRLAPLAPLDMTKEQKALNGVPQTAVRVAFVYPNKNIVLQTYARDAKFLPQAQATVPALATRATYTETQRGSGSSAVSRVDADTPKMVQLKATRMWDFYSDLDHCNALDVLRLQETYDLRGGVATTEQKTLQLRRFFFTAVESIARGTLARETGNAAAKPPTNVYPAADEAHVMTFLRRMLSKHPSFDSIEGRQKVIARYTAPEGDCEFATDDLPCMQVLTKASCPHRYTSPEGDYMSVLNYERSETVLPLAVDYAGERR